MPAVRPGGLVAGRTDTPEVREAVAACGRCPARQACGEYAVEGGEPGGVWGGLLPEERKTLRRTAAA